MKKIFLLLALTLTNVAISFANDIPDVLNNDEALKSIFVDPLGITDAFSDSDAKSVESKIQKAGLEYKNLNIGFGEAFVITPDGFEIGGVQISRFSIMVGTGINMLMYISEPSPQYLDIETYLDSAFKKYGIDPINQNSLKSGDSIRMYLLSPNIGLGISTFKENRTVQVMLIDLNNLNGFMQMGGEI